MAIDGTMPSSLSRPRMRLLVAVRVSMKPCRTRCGLAVLVYTVNRKCILGEIDADVENSHGLPVPSGLMRFATPSWHSLPYAALGRTLRGGEVPFIRQGPQRALGAPPVKRSHT
jgi:hypothetical protein